MHVNATLIYLENEAGEYLMLHRVKKKNDINHDKWIGVGGHFEKDESPEECLLREVREETGLEVEQEGLIGVYTDYCDEYPNGDKAQTILFFFALKVVGGMLSEGDHETLELKWFPPDKVPPLVNRQHEDAWRDAKENRRGVVR